MYCEYFVDGRSYYVTQCIGAEICEDLKLGAHIRPTDRLWLQLYIFKARESKWKGEFQARDITSSPFDEAFERRRYPYLNIALISLVSIAGVAEALWNAIEKRSKPRNRQHAFAFSQVY